MKSVLALFCLAGAASIGNALLLEDIGKKALRGSARERVEIMARSMFALESLLQLPKAEQKIPQSQQDHLIKTIEEQITKVEGSMGKIEDNERQDAELEHQNILLGNRGKIAKKTGAHLQAMRDFRKGLNSKSRVGGLDFVSKMKNAIHFIKKGALNGDKEAEKGLNDSLLRMGQMLGQGPPKLSPGASA